MITSDVSELFKMEGNKYVRREGYSDLVSGLLVSQFSKDPSFLVQDVPSIRKQHVVGVQIIKLEGETAYCQARVDFNGSKRWLGIHLNRNSLEECDLGRGDYFEWVPNTKGVVRIEDITNHPKVCTQGERDKTDKVFDKYRRENPI